MLLKFQFIIALMMGSILLAEVPPRRNPKRVGILYHIHHSFAWRHLSNSDQNLLTVTDVLMNPLKSLFAPEQKAFTDQRNEIFAITQTNPLNSAGRSEVYCYYDDSFNPVAYKEGLRCDTGRMLGVAKRHMKQLADLGADFLVLDNSNAYINSGDYGTEVTYFRAIENFVAYWKMAEDEIRRTEPGFNAPKITLFGAVPSGSNYHQRMLSGIYNNPRYENILFKHHDGRRVFFYVDPEGLDPRVPNASILNEIAQAKITPVPMWTHFGPNGFNESVNYRWDFISPCLERRADGKLHGTTSVTNPNVACNQWVSWNSPLGSVVSVAPTYQIPGGYASQPFASPGRLGGLTLKKQFDTALKHSTDYIFLASWNEHTTGGYFRPDLGTPMGYGDREFPIPPPEVGIPIGSPAYSPYSHYVDNYAAEFSKDLEPTREYGTTLIDITKKYIADYKAGFRKPSNPYGSYALKPKYFSPVWALKTAAGKYSYGTNAYLKDQLKRNGYREICAAVSGYQSDFCNDPNEPNRQQGPFIAYERISGVSKVPVYQCYNSHPNNQNYFFTVNPAECSASSYYRMEPATPIFYAAPKKSKEMMRSVRRCLGRYHFLAIDSKCPAGSSNEGVLGYVH